MWNRGVSFLEDGLLEATDAEFAAGERRAAEYGITWAGYGLDHKVGHLPVAFQRGDWERARRIAASVGAAVSAGPVAGTHRETAPANGPLTPRERAVLEQVALGLTNRGIGEVLFISEKTVSVHLSRLMARLGAAGRAEAVSLAYERGLLVARAR